MIGRSVQGRSQAERLGAMLASVGFTTDAIVTSPKVRARQTAEIVADRLGLRSPPTTGSPTASLDLPLERILVDAGDPARPSSSATTPTSASCSACSREHRSPRCARVPSRGSMARARSSRAPACCAGSSRRRSFSGRPLTLTGPPGPAAAANQVAAASIAPAEGWRRMARIAARTMTAPTHWRGSSRSPSRIAPAATPTIGIR